MSTLVSKKPFIKKFKKTVQKLDTKLNCYVNKQDEESIHDVRIAIRRFVTSCSPLPKKIRKNNTLQNYLQLCKKLFKINTAIRDYDILCGKLEGYSNNSISAELISSLKQKRSLKLKDAYEVASKLQKLDLPKINQKYVSDQKLQRRFYKMISGLNDRIDSEIPIVIKDEKKIDELHSLRKNFKKMRYSMELGTDSKKTLKFIDDLKKIQDMLGEIHDNDIMIDYLNGIKNEYKTKSMINSEIENRHTKYQLFVNLFEKKELITEN